MFGLCQSSACSQGRMLAADLTRQQRAVPDTIRLQHPTQMHNIMSVPWLCNRMSNAHA